MSLLVDDTRDDLIIKTRSGEKSKITPDSLSQFTRNILRVRLVVAGPLLTSLLVFLSGIVLIRVVESELTRIGVVQDKIFSLVITLGIILFISAGVAAIAGFLLSKVIIKPLRRITETVQNIATGDLNTKVKVQAHEEIGALQDSFNDMLDSFREFVHERNKYILESLSGALITMDEEGRITTLNTAAESILGISESSIVNRSIFGVLPDCPENMKIRQMFHNSLDSHITYSSEEVILVSPNHKKIPLGITISLSKNKEGHLTGLVSSFKDLSKIKQIQQQLHRSDRLAAIGTLATGLAHEIRNPLGSIRGLAQLLSEDIKPEDPKKRYATVILKEIDRLNHVVQELLTFSQASSGGMEVNDINAILRDSLFVAKQNPRIKMQGIEFTETYDSQLPMMKIEKEKLIQAFLNIIINAFEAALESSEGNKKVNVKTSLSDARADYPVPNTGFAMVEISNTGSSIPQENLDHIFDPFFTTKETGTGLGLAIAHQIIAAHSGMIEVTSDPNQFTTFLIYIPIIKEVEELNLVST